MDAAVPKSKRASREPAPTTPDPIEIAMEAEASGVAPLGVAYEVLAKQSALLDADLAHRRAQIAGERTSLVLKWLAGAAGFALAGTAATLVWQASQARGLVIAPFSVPPELAARGLSGEVVASQVLDKLTRIQEQTSSTRRPDSMGNDWGQNLKVMIPSTGVSLGDLQAALRQSLGHETQVSGEVYRTPAGAVLAVRLAGHPAFQAAGDERNLDGLAGEVAEQILKATQPYRYSVWLGQNGRSAEKIPFLRGVAASNPDPHERAWAWRAMGRDAIAAGDFGEARSAALEAIRLAPKMSLAWADLGAAEATRGHAEAAHLARSKGIALMPTDSDLEVWGRNVRTAEAQQAEDRGDYAAALASLAEFAVADPRIVGNNPTGTLGLRIRILRLLHRPSEARALAAALPASAIAGDPAGLAQAARVQWGLLRNAEDWHGMVAMAAEPDLVGRAQLFGVSRQDQATSTASIELAYARMMTGDLAGAAAILDDTPLDCDRCLIGRGQLAAAKSDAAGADSWFAKAVAITPSLPQASFEWGRVKLARGDKAGAIKLFEVAHKLGPHWAEPLDYWGSALLAAGDAKGAATKFREADKYAPKWGRNHMLWGEALAAQGKAIEAKAQFTAAAGMDLTPDERARLNQLRARPA